MASAGRSGPTTDIKNDLFLVDTLSKIKVGWEPQSGFVSAPAVSGRWAKAGGQRAVVPHQGTVSVPFTEFDRNIVERCLEKKPHAWEDFIDRYMGLIMHVIRHTAQCRGIRLTPEDRDDLCAEVLLAVIRNDFSVLRNFRGESSLPTYLTVVARRVIVRELLARGPAGKLASPSQHLPQSIPDPHVNAEKQVIAREEVQHLLDGLQGTEALVVRMYHIEGKSYQEISTTVGMPENSIGPILSRAREKLRRAGAEKAVS